MEIVRKVKMYISWPLLLMFNFVESSTTEYCHYPTERCFWVISETLGWDEARSRCQSENGDLAVMETEELFDFVAGTFGNSLTATWIGLTDEHQESDFRWVNNAPLYYDRFHPGEPNGVRTANCFHFHISTLLDDIPCDITRPQTLCSTLAPNCSEPKDGCTSFPTAHMGTITGPFAASDWNSAKSHCESLGQKLMTIDSQEEQNYVDDVLNPSGKIWLGLTDSEVESVFRTPEGFTVPWGNWAQTDPNDGNEAEEQDCAFRLTNGLWADGACGRSYQFYCEAQIFRILVNDEEVTSDELIDVDPDSCIGLNGNMSGCSDQNEVTIKSAQAGRDVSVSMTTGNMTCYQATVAWKNYSNGKYHRCPIASVEEVVTSKYMCIYIFDVTDATMEIKILLPSQAAICDVKIN